MGKKRRRFTKRPSTDARAREKAAHNSGISIARPRRAYFRLVFFLIAAYALWCIGIWFFEPADALVKGTISSADSLDTSFTSNPGEAISPGCGCSKSLGNERGIGILADEIHISNGNDQGAFSLFSGSPGKTSLVPALSFEGIVYQIAVDSIEQKVDYQHLHRPRIWHKRKSFLGLSPQELLDPASTNPRILSRLFFAMLTLFI